MNRSLIFTLILVLLLAACSGADSDNDNDDRSPVPILPVGLTEEDAEKGIRAAFGGNRSEAENYICDRELDDVGTSSMPEGTTMDIACDRVRERMACEVTLTVLNNEPVSLRITADIEDNKLCNFETS